jgi:hypothetical protein
MSSEYFFLMYLARPYKLYSVEYYRKMIMNNSVTESGGPGLLKGRDTFTEFSRHLFNSLKKTMKNLYQNIQ